MIHNLRYWLECAELNRHVSFGCFSEYERLNLY